MISAIADTTSSPSFSSVERDAKKKLRQRRNGRAREGEKALSLSFHARRSERKEGLVVMYYSVTVGSNVVRLD